MFITNKELTPEEIEQNWQKFYGLCGQAGERSAALLAMCDALAERIATCPASSRTSFHAAYAGGLVEHSLRVLTNAAKLCKTFGWYIHQDSLIIGCLMHDIGKVGGLEKDLYVPQTSDWHRDKLGEVYKINEDMQYMTVPDRGIFLCQHFGIKLTESELLSIKLNDGQYAEENKPYKMKEPALAIIVHMADLIATKQEKGQLQ